MTCCATQPVRSSPPFLSAAGQYTMSADAFAPVGQPMRQGPPLLQARRPSRSTVVIAASDGHQCQPSALKPRAAVLPIRPIGKGGMRGDRFGGYAGAPPHPAISMAAAFWAQYGPR